jgi:glycosyltransferase involved in cell wall biosynthesis
MDGQPSVSVVIPCYNYGRHLPACVSSVLGQRGVEVRVLIIDDCSTDDSASVGEALAAAHRQVVFRRHAVNKGHIATYNEGLLEWADGDYVTLLSADDLLTPDSLKRSVELMEANPAVGFVYGRCEEFSDDAQLPAPGEFRGTIASSGTKWIARRAREGVNVVPTPGTVVRTVVHHQVGGYDPDLPHAGDFEMWLRVAAVADVGYVRGAAQGYYRIHSASMSHAVYQVLLADVRQRKMVFDSLFAKHGPELERAGISARATYAKLASHPLRLAARSYEKGTVAELPLDEILRFARDTYPHVERLRAYRALRRRQRLGEAFVHRTQIFIGTTVARRLSNMLWWARWKRYGG